jgi:hypothetical protein
MRFHPKRWASTDQPPGPISTKAPPNVARKISGHEVPLSAKVLHSASIITRDPAIGVHKPTTRSSPSPIASMSKIAGSIAWSIRNLSIPCAMRAIPATSRMSKSPTPGQPRANVENRRCKRTPCQSYSIVEHERSPERVECRPF